MPSDSLEENFILFEVFYCFLTKSGHNRKTMNKDLLKETLLEMAAEGQIEITIPDEAIADGIRRCRQDVRDQIDAAMQNGGFPKARVQEMAALRWKRLADVRGVAVLAVVDAMEKQGRSCEVVAVESINSYGAKRGQWEIEVPIKRAGESADLDRMAFVLAHPSFLRRLIFCAQDILDLNDSGYGQCRETLLDKGDLYFGQMSWDQAPRTDDLLLEWVLEMLKAQGVELEDA
jgi:hypothetical protein